MGYRVGHAATKATFVAGLRFKLAPTSSAYIRSAASIASAARSVAVFTVRPWPIQGERTPHSLLATVLKVLERLRVRPTELMATNAPTTISAAISPYSITVTPEASLMSLLSTDHHRQVSLLTRSGISPSSV